MFELHPQLSRDSIVIGDFDLCRLLLANDSTYPWCILVPKRQGVSEIFQLNPVDRQLLCQESVLLAERLAADFQADKMNVASLGNMVPQLHIHHIVRYRFDPAWPNPVWGLLPAKPYTEEALQGIKTRLRKMLDGDCRFV